MAMTFDQSKLGRHIELAERQASPVGLRGEGPIVPAEADPPRPGDRQQQRTGPVVPQPHGVVESVTGQQVSRVAERHVDDLPTGPGQDARPPTGHPVPDVDLAIVARGREPPSVEMPRQSLDTSRCMPARALIGLRKRQATQKLTRLQVEEPHDRGIDGRHSQDMTLGLHRHRRGPHAHFQSPGAPDPCLDRTGAPAGPAFRSRPRRRDSSKDQCVAQSLRERSGSAPARSRFQRTADPITVS